MPVRSQPLPSKQPLPPNMEAAIAAEITASIPDFQNEVIGAGAPARKATPMPPLPPMTTAQTHSRAAEADFIVYLFLIIIGLPLYLGGARYTYEGIPAAFNLATGWIRLPVQLSAQPIPDSLWGLRLCAIVVVGWLFSRIETRPPTLKHLRARYRKVTAITVIIAWIVFIICFAADAGSTYFGVIKPPASDAWPITQWVATNVRAAWGWSIFLTVAPDWMLVIGWRGMIASFKKWKSGLKAQRPRRWEN